MAILLRDGKFSVPLYDGFHPAGRRFASRTDTLVRRLPAMFTAEPFVVGGASGPFVSCQFIPTGRWPILHDLFEAPTGGLPFGMEPAVPVAARQVCAVRIATDILDDAP